MHYAFMRFNKRLKLKEIFVSRVFNEYAGLGKFEALFIYCILRLFKVDLYLDWR